MKLKIVTLSEDRASRLDILGQSGLSILIESDGGNVLLDAGQGISTVHNADVLGIDLKKIDKIVLSHGHYDHTGGLRELLARMHRKDIEIIAHPDIWATKYLRIPVMERFAGIPFQPAELERLGARFKFTKESVRIADNIITTGEIPLITDFEKISPGHLVLEGNTEKPDEILDDQAIIINTPNGLIVVTGCAHRGVVNTLYHAQKLTGVNKIHMVLGGSHLMEPNNQPRIDATVEALKKLDIEKIGLCHCTGLRASVQLAQAFSERFFFNNAGNIITVE